LRDGSNAEVFPDGEVRKNVAALWNIAKSVTRTGFGTCTAEFISGKLHGTAVELHKTGDGFERSRFANAVAAHETNHFAGRDGQTNIAENTRAVVGNMNVGKREHGYAAFFFRPR
jgi:hypothetical protein